MARRVWNPGRYHRLSIPEKRMNSIPSRVLFRCVLCSVQVTAADRQGHADRAHIGASIAVIFAVVG